jgi:hypothetical protein
MQRSGQWAQPGLIWLRPKPKFSEAIEQEPDGRDDRGIDVGDMQRSGQWAQPGLIWLQPKPKFSGAVEQIRHDDELCGTDGVTHTIIKPL